MTIHLVMIARNIVKLAPLRCELTDNIVKSQPKIELLRGVLDTNLSSTLWVLSYDTHISGKLLKISWLRGNVVGGVVWDVVWSWNIVFSTNLYVRRSKFYHQDYVTTLDFSCAEFWKERLMLFKCFHMITKELKLECSGYFFNKYSWNFWIIFLILIARNALVYTWFSCHYTENLDFIKKKIGN